VKTDHDRVRVALVIALMLTGCTGDIEDLNDFDARIGGGGSDGGGGGGIDAPPASNNEPAGLTGITQMHNEVRAMVGVGPMTWDPALAAVAQSWAEQCVDNTSPVGLIDHNAGRSDNYPGYVGENIYGSSGQATPQGAVSSWASEASDYDYNSNSCSGVCGHYTQMVWADSVKLGCGLYNCPGLQYGSTIVCNYSPGGNTGGRPY
jgi:uncharacterized protein YkwD